jgi:putative endonuclease
VTTAGHLSTGEAGEALAAEYLSRAGYRVVARKYRAHTGEIDIVATRGDLLVFIEVKTRRGCGYGTPAEAVTAAKQRKIVNTAWCYLKQTGKADAPCRFDVIEVLLGPAGGQARCNHIIDAFHA